MRLNESPNSNSILASIPSAKYRGSGFKPSHNKNRLSHGKLTTNKLTKGVKKTNCQYSRAVTVKNFRKGSEERENSWREHKIINNTQGFKGNHWDFNKKLKSGESKKN